MGSQRVISHEEKRGREEKLDERREVGFPVFLGILVGVVEFEFEGFGDLVIFVVSGLWKQKEEVRSCRLVC